MTTRLWLWALLGLGAVLRAQEQPDTLLLKNGEKLIGRFVRSDGTNILFHSDSLGDLTIPAAKIQEIRAQGTYAVIEKKVNVQRGDDPARVPQGSVILESESLTVRGGGGQVRTVPLGETDHVVDRNTFENSILRNPGLLKAWKGTITTGISVVSATQSSQTYTGAISLVRATPVEAWLDRRHRTTFNLNVAYGQVTQPNTPQLRTEIMHSDFEHDAYFTSRLFVFGQTSFDHNVSQGLDLAQNYGGGFGWTVVRRAHTDLDLKASMAYVKQQFYDPLQNQNLVGSVFAENWTRRFWKGATFIQTLTISPAWNNVQAYSGTGTATLSIPVYRRLMFTINAIDNFVNNPSPGFRKNSFQTSTGLSYSLP